MFEQIHYSFGLTSIKVLLNYFFYINLTFLLFGAAGLLAEKVTTIKIPSVGKILVGYALYTSIAWWLYKSGNSKLILPTLLSLVLCIAGYVLVTLQQKKLAPNKIISLFHVFLKRAAPLFVIQLVLIIFWAGFLNDKPYHILVSGNNDVYFWGFMSDHVMGISDVARINFKFGSEFPKQIIDCFGVYSWLGLMGQISTKSHSIEAVMLFQLSLLILSAWLIYEISVVVIGVTMSVPAAFVPAFVFSFNRLWVCVFTNNFLSQMTATFCFLSCIYLIGSSVGFVSKMKNTIFAGFVLYVCFVFSYPGLLVPYISFVVISIGVFKYFLCRARGCTPWKEMATAIIGVTAGISLAALIYYDLTSHAIGRFVVLSGAPAGWPLSMLDPLILIGLSSYSLDNTIFSNWTTYLLLTLLISLVFVVRNFTIKEQSLNEAKYDSLLLLSIMSLVGYLLVYYIKGDSYQQWKFATYFPLPLLLLVGVNYFATKKALFMRVLFYLVFLFVIVGSIQHLIKRQTLYMPSNDLIALRALDQTKYESITLGLEPYRGVMLAANFLGNVDLYSIEDSYFRKVEYRPERITAKNPLLTTADSCLKNQAIDFVRLTNKLILISKVRQLDRNTFFFNRTPSCNGMKLLAVRGFSGIEEWGVWSEGERTEFTVEVSEAYPRGGKLVIDVRPVINPNVVNDERTILVDIDDKYRKRFGFTSSDQATIEMDFDKKDPGSKISIVINHVNPIRFSDISGSDPRRVSLGFLSAKLISNDDIRQIRIASVSGAHDRESDGQNWWHWVERKVSFKLQPLFVPKDATQTKLRFEYGTRGTQTLTLRIIKRNGSSQKVLLRSKGDALAMFEQVIDVSPTELAEISIETDGKASPLGDRDARIAAWILRNVTISPVSP